MVKFSKSNPPSDYYLNNKLLVGVALELSVALDREK